jgi:hypothetical protein
MTPDYDLSNLPTSQADLWVFLQADDILSQILTKQAERLGCPLALRGCTFAARMEEPQAIFNTARRGADV